MPSRNSRKIYVANQFYHVYNRGVAKGKIFLDDEDYVVFLNLIKRYLSKEVVKDSYGRSYANFHHELELLVFCLMPNHVHFLFYLGDDVRALPDFMKRVANTYSAYFNKKYKRVGHLFQDRYKASAIYRDGYLQHISRYIHLNPKDYTTYKWSSYSYYCNKKKASWLKPDRVLEIFDSVADYKNFVTDFADYKESLDDIREELADV